MTTESLDREQSEGAPRHPLDHSVLDEPQFPSDDVCSVIGVSAKQLEHAIDPKRAMLSLSIHIRERVQGKRRLFTGDDVLKIATLFASNGIGFSQRFAHVLAEQVSRRAHARLCGLDTTPGLVFATFPMRETDDWAVVPLWEGRTEEPKLPLAVQLIEIDRLINETVEKLLAIIEDKPLPDFAVPDPAIEASPWSPENDFFRMWDKDAQGRQVYVGLTFEQTQELIALQDLREKTREQSLRYLWLQEIHEGARLTRLTAEREGEK